MAPTLRTLVLACLVVGGMVGVVGAYSPSLDVVHEYDDHTNTLVDVEYDSEFDIVFSLDQDGTFVAYGPQDENPAPITSFDAGHALTIGDGAVYIAAADRLYQFDVEAGNLTELATLPVHPPAIAFDATREVVWVAGNGTVHGYDAADGSEYQTYSPHSGAIEDIAVRGDYVATGTTWTDEAAVYDADAGDVVFEPTLPDDVGQVGAVHLTENGELVVGTGADDGDVVAMFDIATGETLAEYREHLFSVSAVEYLADQDVIASMGFDNTVKFYDVEAGEVAAVYEHPDTIYTGDLDTRNDLLWLGDGEQRTGTVTGIDVFYEAPTPTPTQTPPETTMAQGSDPSPTPEPDPEPTPTTTSANGPGFGLAVAVFALVAVAAFLRRTQ